MPLNYICNYKSRNAVRIFGKIWSNQILNKLNILLTNVSGLQAHWCPVEPYIVAVAMVDWSDP